MLGMTAMLASDDPLALLAHRPKARSSMTIRMVILPDMLTIVLIVLVLAAIGSAPTWPHSRNWGYIPSGGIGIVAIILVLLLFSGRMHF
jgi:hypothetical protein